MMNIFLGISFLLGDFSGKFLSVCFTLTAFYFLQRDQNQMAGDDVSIGQNLWWHCWVAFSVYFMANCMRRKEGHPKPHMYRQGYYIFCVECFKNVEESVSF